MELVFHGAAGEVTGSCTQVSHRGGRFLVDCGLFQGGRDAALKNLRALDFDPKSIDFVLLTHAHLDHAGLLPRLVALGYRGPVIATQATVDLLGVMLLDSAHIQEKEAEWLNRHRRARHARRGWDTAPLYTVAQARSCLERLRAVQYDVPLALSPGVRCTFRNAGHILGSAILELDIDEGHGASRLVMTGDLGQPDRPVLRDPALVTTADYLCIESTYGNRSHRSMAQTEDELAEVLNQTLKHQRGNVIIPAFAVGRTQELLFVLAKLVRAGRVEPFEVVVDSPMASTVTELTVRHELLWDEESRELFDWSRHHADRFRVRFVQDVEESMALNSRESGLVVISASGMCDAGRIKHHLRYNLGRSGSAIVITGFQAAGTLGRRLVDGARTVTVFGERLAVRAGVHTIGGLSAHADQPALLAWLGHVRKPPRQTFIVHGEAGASAALAGAVETTLGWPAPVMPVRAASYVLD